MVAALTALGGAIVTVVVYVSLTERMDYASVPRRQLDTWAAVMALACLTAIVYAGAASRQADIARARHPRSPLAPAEPHEILRRRRPDLGSGVPTRPGGDAGSSSGQPSSYGAPPPAEARQRVAMPGYAPAHGGTEPQARPPDAGAPVPFGVLPLANAPAPGVAPTPTAIARLVPAYRDVTPMPIATADQPAVRPVIITAVPVFPTLPPPPPPAAPPTPAPPAEPTAPPQCGDPGAIDVRVEITEAEADRRSDPQAVRYAVRVRNASSFPLSLTNIAATAQDSRSGSDQFGSDRKSYDIDAAPGRWVEIQGTIKLEKFPSPFGRSELCISFVAETCGRRSPQKPVTRRCSMISGF